MPVADIIAAAEGKAEGAERVSAALARLAAEEPARPPARVLICGSLYLAGEILRQQEAAALPASF